MTQDEKYQGAIRLLKAVVFSSFIETEYDEEIEEFLIEVGEYTRPIESGFLQFDGDIKGDK